MGKSRRLGGLYCRPYSGGEKQSQFLTQTGLAAYLFCPASLFYVALGTGNGQCSLSRTAAIAMDKKGMLREKSVCIQVTPVAQRVHVAMWYMLEPQGMFWNLLTPSIHIVQYP